MKAKQKNVRLLFSPTTKLKKLELRFPQRRHSRIKNSMLLVVMKLLAIPTVFSREESRNGKFRKLGRLIKRNFDFFSFLLPDTNLT